MERSTERDSFWFPFIVLVSADAAIFFGSVMLAYLIRFSPWFMDFFPHTEGSPLFSQYVSLGLYITVLGIFVFQRFGLYARRVGMERRIRPWSIVSAVVVAYVFLMAWLFVYVNWRYNYSRWVVFLSLVLSAAGSFGCHFLLREFQTILVHRGLGFERTVVVAALGDLQWVLERLRVCHGSRHHVLGVVMPEAGAEPGAGGRPVLGGIDEIESIIQPGRVDRVVVALPPRYQEEALGIFRKCRQRGIEVRMAPALFEAVTERLRVGEGESIPTISLGETPLTGTYALVKDSLDVIVAGVLLTLSLPLMAAISVLIKLDSRGPVFYRQERIGVGGKLFTLLKFRTMKVDAEAATGPVFARPNDPRCTRLGQFLRRYNLDELPQFLNVLKGEMAVVGPRPERPFFVNRFKAEIPGYMRRHVVKPGMTGWAQIHGLRGDTSVRDRTAYDIYYIENWSLALDIKILLRTILASRNAY